MSHVSKENDQQYFITLVLPSSLHEHDVDLIADLFETPLAAITDKPEHNSKPLDWRIRWLVDTQPCYKQWADQLNIFTKSLSINLPQPIASNDFKISPVPDTDWVAHNLEHFNPIQIGSFIIFGSHSRETLSMNDSHIGLEINATTAFGTGQHPTTHGCLVMLETLLKDSQKFHRILDMGTGTGILAIAAEKLWPDAKLIGIDNDPDSIDVAKEHADLNHNKSTTFEVGDGFQSDDVYKHSPYDLIIANILARPLKQMAHDLCSHISHNGYVLLSGLLNTQAPDVIHAYEKQDLTLERSFKRDEWSTLLFKSA